MSLGPLGPDALARRARREAQRREEEVRTVRRYGPDAGELEPCPHCDEPACDPWTCPQDPENAGHPARGDRGRVLLEAVRWQGQMLLGIYDVYEWNRLLGYPFTRRGVYSPIGWDAP